MDTKLSPSAFYEDYFNNEISWVQQVLGDKDTDLGWLGWNYLLKAGVECASPEIVKLLLNDERILQSFKSAKYYLAMNFAVQFWRPKKIKLFLDLDLFSLDDIKKMDEKQSIFHYALKMSDVEVVSFFIENGLHGKTDSCYHEIFKFTNTAKNHYITTLLLDSNNPCASPKRIFPTFYPKPGKNERIRVKELKRMLKSATKRRIIKIITSLVGLNLPVLQVLKIVEFDIKNREWEKYLPKLSIQWEIAKKIKFTYLSKSF